MGNNIPPLPPKTPHNHHATLRRTCAYTSLTNTPRFPGPSKPNYRKQVNATKPTSVTYCMLLTTMVQLQQKRAASSTVPHRLFAGRRLETQILPPVSYQLPGSPNTTRRNDASRKEQQLFAGRRMGADPAIRLAKYFR